MKPIAEILYVWRMVMFLLIMVLLTVLSAQHIKRKRMSRLLLLPMIVMVAVALLLTPYFLRDSIMYLLGIIRRMLFTDTNI